MDFPRALALVSVVVLGGLVAASEGRAQTTVFLPTGLYRPVAKDLQRTDAAAAAKWMAGARTAIDEGKVAEALRCAAAALVHDPNGPTARRLLGQQRVGDEWAGGYAARLLQAGRLWNRQWGWVKEDDLPQWESGRRPSGRRWVSSDDDAQRHATIDKGWTLRTDHFHVVTNQSRAAAVELAARLEGLYLVWLQRFGDFALDANQLKQRWEGKNASGYRRQPFRVVYHKSRAQYNDALRRHQPQIDQTLGIYFDHLRECHFFAGPDQDPSTLRHEAVHQFFQESIRTSRNTAAIANAWAVEGAACYFESLETLPQGGEFVGAPPDALWVLGGVEAGRLAAARQRRLSDGYYVPLAELAPLGMHDLQKRTDLRPLYSQAAGLATFLMEGRAGNYRDSFVELLRRIYAGHDQAGTLEGLVGVSYRQLDQQYEQYLRQTIR